MTQQTAPPTGLDAILRDLPRYRQAAEDCREQILGNLVLIGEVPAPTFGEARRVETFIYRLSDSGLLHCSMDQMGNGIAMLPGTDADQTILLVANADSVFDETTDHTIELETDRVIGCGLSDNSVGLAVLASLPAVLERLQLRLKSNLVLLAAARSLGRGNLEGARYFLANNKMPIRHGICIDGVPLGRLSYVSLGMLRGDVTVKVPTEYDWSRFGASGAVIAINQVVSRMAGIPLPRRPLTTIVMGSIEGGNSYDQVAHHAVLRFEILSESLEMVGQIGQQIDDIVAEVSSQSGADITLDIFARREPGGIEIGHPMVRCARKIMDALELEPRILPSTSESAALIDHKIPAVTLGLTSGDSINAQQEAIQIKPLFTGLAQLVGLLQALDGGYSNEV